MNESYLLVLSGHLGHQLLAESKWIRLLWCGPFSCVVLDDLRRMCRLWRDNECLWLRSSMLSFLYAHQSKRKEEYENLCFFFSRQIWLKRMCIVSVSINKEKTTRLVIRMIRKVIFRRKKREKKNLLYPSSQQIK
jgi:hypothetical protein